MEWSSLLTGSANVLSTFHSKILVACQKIRQPFSRQNNTLDMNKITTERPSVFNLKFGLNLVKHRPNAHVHIPIINTLDMRATNIKLLIMLA